MSLSSFGAREVGRAWTVLKTIADTPTCGVILTVSGAMTVAKMGQAFAALIDRGFIGAVVTTGAVVTHGLVEEAGMQHFKAPDRSDAQLFEARLNRIYDSVEPEYNLERLEELTSGVLESFSPDERVGSAEIVRRLASSLSDVDRGNGFLATAARMNIRVFVPALTDSEVGLYMYRLRRSGRPCPQYDPFLDLRDYEEWVLSQRSLALLTVGGGVPRNWAQQILPFLASSDRDHGTGVPPVVAAVRICPDPAAPGHLSGSPYSEGVSWGKFPASALPSLVDVHADATIVLPFLVRALVDYIDSQGGRSRTRTALGAALGSRK